MGAMKVSELAKALEFMAHDDCLEEPERILVDLEDAYREAETAMKALLE